MKPRDLVTVDLLSIRKLNINVHSEAILTDLFEMYSL